MKILLQREFKERKIYYAGKKRRKGRLEDKTGLGSVLARERKKSLLLRTLALNLYEQCLENANDACLGQ